MFRKKEVEEVQEPLSTLDIAKIKQKLNESEDKSLSVRDLVISDIVPQSCKYGVIQILDGRHVLFLNETVNKDKYKSFNKSAMGRFNSDVVKFTNKKNPGKYLLIEGKGERKIVRLIEDEDLLLYQTLKLIDGIIKDKPYMILRNLEEGEKLTSSKRYVKEINNENADDLLFMNINPVSPTEEDDIHESISSSISLFDE